MKEKYILYDMNYFYAQVEIRDNPKLKRKPVAVGGEPNERGGIITTCNYIAREFGIHAGMPSLEAKDLCRSLIIVRPNMRKYALIQKQIKSIVEKYSDDIEFIALDEAYINVTHTEWLFDGAEKIALEIQNRILEETNLTCSVGIGYNKMTAKLAADQIKPSGFFVMDTRKKFLEVMSDKSVKKIPGIGEKISYRLNRIGIYTVKDLQDANPFILKQEFKKVMTNWLQNVCQGYSNYSVGMFHREGVKGIGKSVTLMQNTRDYKIIKNTLIDIAMYLSRKLKDREKYCTDLTLKLKWETHKTQVKTKHMHSGINRPEEILAVTWDLLEKVKLTKCLRGVGISVSGLVDHRYTQLSLEHKFKEENYKVVEDLKKRMRDRWGKDIIYEGAIECERQKDKEGKTIRGLYLRL